MRAAAYSAWRAGFEPLACDLFADADLGQLCRCVRVRGYPAGLVTAASKQPAAPFLYTGGLENYPATVDGIAAERRLLGNPGEVLRAVRDPYRVTAALERHGLDVPRCEPLGAAPAADGTWLLKRRASSGGAGVRPWNGMIPRSATPGDLYLQQRIAGRPCAAVFVAARGQAMLVGVSEQLIGAAWCGGRGFQYCGSLGPLRLSPATRDRFRRIGDCLASEFGLTGLVGVDAIVNRRGVWPLEVNPRYTASVEVLERVLGIPAVRWHVEACLHGALPRESASRGQGPRWCGKAILFARRPLQIDRRLAAAVGQMTPSPLWGEGRGEGKAADRTPLTHPSPQRGEGFATTSTPPKEHWPAIADIPTAGSRIAAHRPILTVLAAGATRAEVLRRLRVAARKWQSKLTS